MSSEVQRAETKGSVLSKLLECVEVRLECPMPAGSFPEEEGQGKAELHHLAATSDRALHVLRGEGPRGESLARRMTPKLREWRCRPRFSLYFSENPRIGQTESVPSPQLTGLLKWSLNPQQDSPRA